MDSSQRELERFFPGHSEMAGRMRLFDWSKSLLGPPQSWPQNLKTSVRILLTSRQPMFVWWGEQLINLYNDGYAAFLCAKHPWALGQPASAVWPEIWHQVGPRVEFAMRRGEGTYDEALPFIMYRKGYAEETFVTFSYSPIPDDGGFGGILCPVTEETQRIIGERQLAFLRELATKTAEVRTTEQACTLVESTIKSNSLDLPLALVYLIDSEKRNALLAVSSGVSHGSKAAPETVPLDAACVWPLGLVFRSRRASLVFDLAPFFEDVPLARGQYPITQAIALPILPSDTGPGGILIVGLNPLRPFDDSYRQFLELIGSGISAPITNGQAYESERRRAEALAEIDRAKTVFFSNVSHEFRTPLTLILGPIEGMLASASRNEGDSFFTGSREELDLVHRNTLRLLKLVNTLLDFSRIEASRIEADYEPIDLAAYTTELASSFQSAIEKAGLQLIVDCPPLPQPVYVDRPMWEKIVLNLLSNAFKFTFQGEIKVALRWCSEQVELIVADTGVGIPEGERAYIFERFHRVHGTRSRTHEGTGIGLSLVQELVRLHGGAIRFESEEDRGTTFCISIPTGTGHLPKEHIGIQHTARSLALGPTSYVEESLRWLPPEERQRERVAEEVSVSPARGFEVPPPHILIADDNPDMRQYVRRILSDLYRVTAVADGRAALAAAWREPPDLILADVMMPHLDGLGLLHAVRVDPRFAGVPVVLLSARAGEEATVEGMRAGADDYLTKPFSARELLARVDSQVRRKRAEEALRQAHDELEQRVVERTRELVFANDELRREITERKRAEKRLREYEKCVEGLEEMIAVVDRNYCYLLANRAFLYYQGLKREELIGRRVPEVLNPGVFEQVAKEKLDQCLQGNVVKYDLTYSYPSLGERDLSISYSPIEGPNGVDRVACVLHDITERKRAEEELRRREAYLVQAQKLSHTGSWALNVATGELFWSEEHFRIAGLNPESEKPIYPITVQIIHPEDRGYAQQVLESAIRERRDFEVDCRIVRPDGSVRYIHSMAEPFFNEAGALTEYMGTIIDNTERRQAEDALQKARTELAHIARVTTMGELAASIAHEVKQPLSAVVNDAGACLTWLQRPQPNFVEAKDAATRIMEEGMRASEVLSRIRSLLTKSPPQISIVYLNEIINEVLLLTRYEIVRQNIALGTELADDLHAVRGDSVQLKQVLANLIINAVEAMHELGGRSRDLQITSQNVRSHEILVVVRDSGIGLRPGTLEEMFQPFVTDKPDGMGMGLAISRSIVEAHGGRLWATTNEDAGSTFQFSLPALEVG